MLTYTLRALAAAACLGLSTAHAQAAADAPPAQAGTQAQTATPAPPAQTPPAAVATPAFASDPKFQAAMQNGAKLMKTHQPNFAADEFKKANKIAGGQCVLCLSQLVLAQMAMGDPKAAAASAQQLETVLTRPADKSRALAMQGRAMLVQAGDKPKPSQLEAIHPVFEKALALNPKNTTALFLDAQVQARLGHDDAAKQEFAACASCLTAGDPMRLRAEHFAEDPSRSTAKMAPAFEVTTLDGHKFQLDAMGGRVVLIDFWATWCGPCNRELPEIKHIAAEFANDPLVILSVSWDADEAKWKDFIAKNGMNWPQYRDADHALTEMFGINAIPHYFTIDSDGVLTAEMLGEDSNVEGKLKKLIARAREAQPAQHAGVAMHDGQ